MAVPSAVVLCCATAAVPPFLVAYSGGCSNSNFVKTRHPLSSCTHEWRTNHLLATRLRYVLQELKEVQHLGVSRHCIFALQFFRSTSAGCSALVIHFLLSTNPGNPPPLVHNQTYLPLFCPPVTGIRPVYVNNGCRPPPFFFPEITLEQTNRYLFFLPFSCTLHIRMIVPYLLSLFLTLPPSLTRSLTCAKH